MRWLGLLLVGLAAIATLLWVAAPERSQDVGGRQPDWTGLGTAAADALVGLERVEKVAASPIPTDGSERGAAAALPSLTDEDSERAAEHVPPAPSAAPQADRQADLARSVAGPDSAVLADQLRAWSELHASSVQAALAEWRAVTPTDGRRREAAGAEFNQRMEELGAALEHRFGRPQAARIALAGGLHRVDVATGEIYAVDLDGRRLSARLDPSE